MVLSLQGCMAVGKTTAARYLQEHAPYLHISYESNGEVIKEVKKRKLNKNVYEDYLEIQRLWLRNEVVRYEEAIKYPCSVMDFGAEEIIFYAINYPQSIGAGWEVENALRSELDAARKCIPERILFMDASDEVLQARKDGDATRSREFFEYYLQKMMPLKREWFLGKENVDVLRIDGLSIEEVGEKVKNWCDDCMHRIAIQSKI